MKNIFGQNKLNSILGTLTKAQEEDLKEFISGSGAEIVELQGELALANAEQVQAQNALTQINKIVGN